MKSNVTIFLVCVTVILIVLFTTMYKDQRVNNALTSGSNIAMADQSNWLKGFFPDVRRSAALFQPFEPMKIQTFRNNSFDYKAEMQKLNDAKVDQDDPRLVRLIRDYYLVPPSTEPYNLDAPYRLDYSRGQTPIVDSRLNFTEGGFYVECGGLNGERGSNSLFFEKNRKWNGLLVEADPINFEMLIKKHRKAFIINACLNTEKHPGIRTFKQAQNTGRIVENKQQPPKGEVNVQCFPLYSILLALNRTTIDFFSLDVEGAEIPVMETIPFDKVDIKIMTVEYAHGGGANKLKSYGESKGYDALVQVSHWNWGVNDIIFGKKSYKIPIN